MQIITYLHNQNHLIAQILPQPTKTAPCSHYVAGSHVLWHCCMCPEGSAMCPAL